jgi:hypothetical protein
LTVFLKVLEKQQEAPLSAGFVAQKVGSRSCGSGSKKRYRRVKTVAAALAGECQDAALDDLI